MWGKTPFSHTYPTWYSHMIQNEASSTKVFYIHSEDKTHYLCTIILFPHALFADYCNAIVIKVKVSTGRRASSNFHSDIDIGDDVRRPDSSERVKKTNAKHL